MAYNAVNCVASLLNTGLSNCLDNLGYDAMILWTTESFEIANEAASLLEATYVDAIDAGTMYPMPIFEEVEPAIEDDVEEELSTGISLFVREGKYGGVGRMRSSLCTLPNLRTFNEVQGRAFIVTGNSKIFGTSPDGIIFKGFDLSKFHVSGLKGTDGTTKRKIEIRYQMKDITEMADFPAVPNIGTTWNPLTLTGVVDVTVTVDSSAAATVVVSIARVCDGEAVTGLVEGDFIMLDNSGVTVLPATTYTDNADGSYTFTFAPVLASEAHTVNLATPAAQTTGGYESTGSDSFTIP